MINNIDLFNVPNNQEVQQLSLPRAMPLLVQDGCNRSVRVMMTNSVRSTIKVCYIFQDEYPWDVRVEKITNSLIQEGMEVHIVCRNRNLDPSLERVNKKLVIHRLPHIKNQNIRHFLNFPAFFSPIWLNTIITVIKKYAVDIIIVRDLPLSLAGFISARITRTPIIIDMAENYPALIKSTWDFRGANLADYILRNPLFLKWMEKLALNLTDGIIVVSKYSAERVKNIIKKPDNVWIVSNTPIIENIIKSGSSKLSDSIRNKSTFILLYTGFVETHRGLDIVIQAIPALKEFLPDLLLVITGEGTYTEKLKARINELKIENHVFFTGYVRHKETYSIIKTADVCLIPHYVTEHTNTTIPNKIFDYMSQKKPVIATQSKSLTEIINSSKCGVIYQDNSSESFSSAVRSLIDPEKRTTLGKNGWNAVLEKYNWNYDKKIMFDAVFSVIEDVERKKKNS